MKDLDDIADFVIVQTSAILADNDTATTAKQNLNIKINNILLNSYNISTEIIAMWLRSTWGVRQYIRNWDQLLIVSRKLFKDRHGQDQADLLLYGLQFTDFVV